MIIEKNIPIPARTYGGLKRSIGYLMELGDSVFAEEKTKAACVVSALRRRGLGSAQRKEGDGFRIWCVEKNPKK